jgi:hypothetical protein
MADIKHNDTTFYIADEVQTKYPELIKLILHTESMDDDERQYWFDIMPSMTDSQVDRLYNILETEKQKLEELEDKYQKEIKSLNEKHLIEWQEFQAKKSKEKMAEVKKNEKADEKNPDDVLSMLDDM